AIRSWSRRRVGITASLTLMNKTKIILRMVVRTHVFALLCMLYAAGGMAQKPVSLIDLDLSKAWQEYGTVQKGRVVTSEPAQINGVTYDGVLGVHAKSIIKVQLDGRSERFTAKVGIADSQVDISNTSLTIIPLVD